MDIILSTTENNIRTNIPYNLWVYHQPRNRWRRSKNCRSVYNREYNQFHGTSGV